MSLVDDVRKAKTGLQAFKLLESFFSYIEILNSVITGDYDSEDSEELFNRIETASNSIDSTKYDSLISQAMDKWFERDNAIYAE